MGTKELPRSYETILQEENNNEHYDDTPWFFKKMDGR